MKDTIRVAVWPHLSVRGTENNPENIMGDSNFHVIRLVINELMKRDKDWHWYFSIPKGCIEFFAKTFKKNENNFTWIERDMGGTGSGTKLYCDLKNFSKNFKGDYVADILWNNVVEINLQLQQMLFSKGIRPMSMTYTHWPPDEISRTYKYEFDYKWGGYVSELNYLVNYTSSTYNSNNNK